jgi:uncharacterized membrane protein YGL010W
MKTLTDHLSQYAAYHRDRRNIITHFVGIPMIVLAIIILLSRPAFEVAGLSLTPALLGALASAIFYLRLDRAFGVTMAVLLALCVWAGNLVAAETTATWLTAGISLFVIGWVFQFVGHYYEGRKPAFVDDLSGLIIGLLFVAAEAIFLLGLRQDLNKAIEARVGPVHNRSRDHDLRKPS